MKQRVIKIVLDHVSPSQAKVVVWRGQQARINEIGFGVFPEQCISEFPFALVLVSRKLTVCRLSGTAMTADVFFWSRYILRVEFFQGGMRTVFGRGNLPDRKVPTSKSPAHVGEIFKRPVNVTQIGSRRNQAKKRVQVILCP